MVEPPSHPPSDPRPIVRRGAVWRPSQGRPLGVEIAAALALGVLLVAVGLYLWRRPRAPAGASGAESASSVPAPAPSAAAAPPPTVDAVRPSAVTLSEARVLECHDRGPKKTPPEQCDHLSPIEKALADAVEQSAACASPSTGAAGADGGTIEYVADVSFLRRRVSVTLPRAGRSVRDRKVLVACASAVRGAMGSLPFEHVDHQHARYRISVTATYPRRAPPG